MPFSAYSQDMVYDVASKRGVGGAVAQVTDLTTGIPVTTYDENGAPRPVITNPQGYFPTFWTDDTVQQVMVRARGVSLPKTSEDLIQSSVNATFEARDAAAAAQQAAEDAANLVGAPADTAIAAAVNGSTSSTRTALNGLYAGKALATSSVDGLMSAADKALVSGAATILIPNSLVKRDASNQFNVGTPTSIYHPTPKSYVDGLAVGVVLPSTAHDLNDYTSPGIFNQTLDAGAAASANYPIAAAGKLDVKTQGAITWQTYQGYQPQSRIFWRSKYSTIWSSWREGADLTALASSIAARQIGNATYSVVDYGATGNGTTDDTGAIQAALTAIKTAGGGTIIFPPGKTYVMDGYVTMCDDLTILGYGATIKKLAGSTSSTCFVGFSNGTKGYGSGPSRIRMEGLTFRGTFTGSTRRAVCAMSLNHTDDLTVRSVQFIEASGGGHQFDLQACRRINIEDSTWQGFSLDFGLLYSESIQLDCSFRIGGSEKDSSGSYDGLPCRDVTVQRCRFLPLTIGATTHPSPIPMGCHAAGVGMYHKNIKFLNNYMENLVADTTSNTPGILHWLSMDGLEISGNTFNNTTSAECQAVNIQRCGWAYALADVENASAVNTTLAVSQASKNVTINNNTFIGFKATNTSAHTIMIYGSSEALAEGIETAGNTFQDIGGGYTGTTGGACIRLVWVRRIAVSRNNADNIKCLLDVESSRDVVFEHNQATRVSSTNPLRGTTVIGLVISANTCTTSRGGMDLTGCEQVAIAGNQLTEDSAITNGPAMIRIVGASKTITVSANVIKGTATTASAISIGGASVNGMVSGNVIVWGGTTKIFIAADSSTILDVNNVKA